MLHPKRRRNKPQRPAPRIAQHPFRLFVEPTTRCNLRCPMCVKQSREQAIGEGDLASETFDGLQPALPFLETLVLTGIGEPLLHPGLEEFVACARSAMPRRGEIGIQTNGLLLDRRRARSLVESGLSRICISLDAAAPETFRRLRRGAEVGDVEAGFANAVRARNKARRPLDIGAEFVMQRDNLRELPHVVETAADLGADFLLVSQMLPYSRDMADLAIYGGDTDVSRAFFRRWRKRAQEEQIELDRYFRTLGRYRLSAQERAAAEFVRRMNSEAARLGIPLNLRSLLQGGPSALDQARTACRSARRAARDRGVRLILPSLVPRFDRYCPFAEEGAAFVAWQGTVHPCHFLWHGCACYPFGRRKLLEPVTFGDLRRSDILEIWRNPDFLSFRSKVLEYDYPFCWSCNVGPCNLIQGEPFEHDCHAVDVPCGDCPWCSGLLQCLR